MNVVIKLFFIHVFMGRSAFHDSPRQDCFRRIYAKLSVGGEKISLAPEKTARRSGRLSRQTLAEKSLPRKQPRKNNVVAKSKMNCTRKKREIRISVTEQK